MSKYRWIKLLKTLKIYLFWPSAQQLASKIKNSEWFDVVIGYYCDRHTFYNHQNFIANANWAYFNRLIWTHLFQKFTLEIDRQVMRTLIPICEHFKLNVLHQLHQNWGCQLIKFDTYLIWTRYKNPNLCFFNIRGFEIFWNFVRWWNKES